MPDVLLFGAEELENLSTRYLAAVLRQHNISVELAGFSSGGELEAAVWQAQQARPRLVGLSIIFQYRAPEFFALAEEIKKALPDVHICAGGHFPTFAAADILRHNPAIDTIARGEGERTLLELVQNLDNQAEWSGIAGLSLRQNGSIRNNPARPLIPDLDSLPFPARDTPPQSYLGIVFSPIVGSRGCYRDCSFCSIRSFYGSSGGPAQRFRSVFNLVDEMELLYHHSNVRFFIFNDDEWFPPGQERYARTDDMANELRHRNMEVIMSIKCRADDVERDHFLRLREMGVARAYVGVESGSDNSLRRLNKLTTVAQNRHALETLHEVGMLADFGLIFFDPDSTIEDIRANLDFFHALAGEGQSPLSFGRLEVYAGTPVLERLNRESRLSGSYLSWNYTIGDERVETLFRLMIAVLGRRHYPNEGLAKQCSIACYEHIMYQFVLGSQADTILGQHLRSIVARANGHSLAILSEMLEYTLNEDFHNANLLNDQAVKWATRVNLFDLEMKTELAGWRARLAASVESRQGDKDALDTR